MKNKKKILSLLACLSLLTSCNKSTPYSSSCKTTTSTPSVEPTPTPTPEKIDITKYIKTNLSTDGVLEFTGFSDELTDEMKLKVTEFEFPSEVNGVKLKKLGLSSFYKFYGFDNLETIKISKEINSIYYYTNNLGGTFVNLPSLKSIIVDENNETYYTEGNCLINKNDKTIITGWGDIVIPNDITEIRNYAFNNCLSVTSVKLHPNVNKIGKYSFKLTSITDIDLNGNTNFTKKSEIINGKENFIFYQDSTIYYAKGDDLTINMPEFANNLNLNGFKKIKNLTLGENIISIDTSGFRYSLIETISLPKSLTTIGDTAFDNMNNLKNITLSSENTSFKLSGNCLYGLTSTKNYRIYAAYGDVIMPDEITNGHFQNKTSITSIKLNAIIKDITWNSFSWSNYDTNYLANNKRELKNYYLITVDSNNPYLKVTKNGRGLIKIGDDGVKTLIYAIPDLNGNIEVDDDIDVFGLSGINNVCNPNYIKSITFYEGLKKISPIYNYSLFSSESKPIEIESLTLPSTLTKIEGALSGFNFFALLKINSLSINGGNNQYFQITDNCLIQKGGKDDGSDQFIYGIKDMVIPESVTTLDAGQFYKNYSLTSITLHNKFTSLKVSSSSSFGPFYGLQSNVKTIKFLGTLDEFKNEINSNNKEGKTSLYQELKNVNYGYTLIVLNDQGQEVSYKFSEI